MSSHATDPKTAIRKGVPAPWLSSPRFMATTALVALCALAPQARPAAAQATAGSAEAAQSFEIPAQPLASALNAAQATAGSAEAAQSFEIPAQPLASALNAFGRQAGLQVTLASSTTRGLTSRAVNGRYTPRQALALMLEGTGLPFHITADRTAMVGQQNAVDAGAVGTDGSLLLGTIDVSGGNAANLPFETPGSTNFISGEELERFPGLTSGSIFQGTPGVISGSSNNGAAIDPNIRGLQGMNRVVTTIDGSQQSTSSYRGYQGVDNRTYVDPDLISGITITKGPDGPVGGAIGGTIAMETLGVTDILKPGDTYGVRIRGGLSSNGVAPVIGETNMDAGQSDTGNGNISLAAAVTTEKMDLVAAFVRRTSGNYFAGTHGTRTTENADGEQQLLSGYGYGQQVFNTSEDVTSALLKATIRPMDGHELQLGYMHYDNTFGEVTAANASVGNIMRQIPLSSVAVDQITARYHYKPDDNELVDFRLNTYASNVDENTVYAVYDSAYLGPQTSQNAGVELFNVSRFTIANTPLALRYGGSWRYEHAAPDGPLQSFGSTLNGAYPAHAQQQVSTLFAKAKWEPLSWLAIDGGLEYLNYDSDFLGTQYYAYTGADFTGYSGSGVSPSASITITPLAGWQIYAQYQSGIRPPSVRETSQVRYDQGFNPDLDAEQASNWEIGTNFLRNDLFLPGDKARLKLAYFDNTTNDYIGRTYNLGLLSLFNYDYVRFKGFELSGGYDAKWGFVDFGFNYYTGFESCLKNGECMNYTLQADYLANQMPPRFTASVTAGLRFWDDKLTVGGRLTYMGQRLAPLVEDPTYFWITKAWAPYTVVDAFATWKINDTLTLDVNAQNLFDAYYVDALNNTDMPAPGRTIRGTLTAKLGGNEPVSWLPFGRPASSRNMPWTGFYLGAQAGYGFGAIDGTTTPIDGSANAIAASESADQSLAGIFGGAQAGYNHQFSNGFVLGLEADFAYMRLASHQDVLSKESATLIQRNQLEAHIDYAFDWLSTVRGRAGYATDRLFIYGTGGVAFLKEVEERTQYRATTASSTYPAGYATQPFFTETSDAVRTGYVLGAGAEYAIADNWSLKLEYLFAGFGAEDFEFDDARAGVSKPYTVTTRCTRNNYTPPCPGGKTVTIVTNYPGSSETVNGRRASNDAALQLLKIGVNYRF
jgi:hemoglobin/transferrin/lactoferrin receptor protein